MFTSKTNMSIIPQFQKKGKKWNKQMYFGYREGNSLKFYWMFNNS